MKNPFSRFSEKNSTPKQLEYSDDSNTPWNMFPIGINENQEEVFIDFQKSNSVLITGGMGTGKTNIQRSLIAHCLKHPDKWEAYTFDFKNSDFRDMHDDSVIIRVALTVEEAFEDIKSVHKTMEERYRIMEEEKVGDFSLMSQSPKAIIVNANSFVHFLMPTNAQDEESKRVDALREESSNLITDILHLGLSAGIYIAISMQRPDSNVLPSSVKELMKVRVVTGRADSISSNLTLGNDAATHLDPHDRGAAYIQTIDGKGEKFRAYLNAL